MVYDAADDEGMTSSQQQQSAGWSRGPWLEPDSHSAGC